MARGAYAPEDMRIITDAYTAVVAKLNLQEADDKEKSAKIVVQIVREGGSLEAERLVQSALAQLARG